MRLLFLALLIHCSVVGAAAANDPQTSVERLAPAFEVRGHTPAIVSFQLIANAVVVHVKLNGRGPYALLFDSGAVNFISPQIAEELDLAVGESEEGSGIGKRTVTVGETEVESVQIGEAVLHRQRFHVVPLPYVMEHGFPEAIVGGVGYELLQRIALRIDFARRQLSMWDGATFQYHGRGDAVPFVLQGHVPIVNGSVDGLPGMFEIDTGAEDSLSLNTPFVKQNDVMQKYSARLYGFAGEGIGGRENAYFVRVHKFEVGSIPVHSIVTELSQDTAGATSESTIAGIVGIGVLKRFNIVFDYRDRKIYVEKNSNYDHPSVFNRAGFAPRITAEGLKVVSVFQNSPASEAGIAPADLIVAINGRLSHDLDVPFLYTVLRQQPGTRIRLKVLHDGVEKNVEIRLRELL